MSKRDKIIRAICRERSFSLKATNKVIDYVDITLRLHKIGESLFIEGQIPGECDTLLLDKQNRLLKELESYGEDVLRTGLFLGFSDWSKVKQSKTKIRR